MKQNRVPKIEYSGKEPSKFRGNHRLKDRTVDGLVFTDSMGQWAHPGQITEIPGTPSGTPITMQGVPYPVQGIDNTGHSQMMYPGMNYTFPGNTVTEYPMALYGGDPNRTVMTGHYPFGGQNTKTHTHMKDGGSLNRKVTCSNCGWSWRLVDGGTDPTTCHKCGGTIKMQNGGWLDTMQVGGGKIDFEGSRRKPTSYFPKSQAEAQEMLDAQKRADYKKPDLTEYYKEKAYRNKDQGTVKEYVPQGNISKSLEIAANPLPAMKNYIATGRVPDHFSQDAEESMLSPTGVANMAYQGLTGIGRVAGMANAGYNVPIDLAQGNYLSAGLNALDALPGIPGNIKNLQNKYFPKSEINWGAWNKEIPKNKALMNEYNVIEQSSKAKGTWVKYSDGTPFTGTPEQFVQMNHKNAIDFAGGDLKLSEQMYKKDLHRGGHQHITDFKNRDRNDYATFLTDNKVNAESYAGSDGLQKTYYHPDVNTSGEWKDGIYQLGFPQNLPKVIGEAEGKNWRLLNYDENVAKNIGNNAKRHNEFLKENQIRNTYQDVETASQYDPSKNYLSTDNYATYVKGNKEAIAQINNVKDQMGFATNIPTNTVYAVDANRVPLKSLRYNNGMFDMTNPNIYKSLLPFVGASYLGAKGLKKEKYGGWLDKMQTGGTRFGDLRPTTDASRVFIPNLPKQQLTKAEKEEAKKYEKLATAKNLQEAQKKVAKINRVNAANKAQETQGFPTTRQEWADQTQALGDKLSLQNLPVVGKYIPDMLDVTGDIGSMGASLGSAPLRAQQESSYIPYLDALSGPLLTGALAGVGAKNTKQFVNNIVNPFGEIKLKGNNKTKGLISRDKDIPLTLSSNNPRMLNPGVSNELPPIPSELILPTHTPSPWQQVPITDDVFEGIKNRSGLSKDEALAKASAKDKNLLSKMSDEEFKKTVLKPTGEVVSYKPGPEINQMGYNMTLKDMQLKNAIHMSHEDYVKIFNSRLDLLNEIIARNNKTGINYYVQELTPHGQLIFSNPAQVLPGVNPNMPNHYKTLYGHLPSGTSTWDVSINPGEWVGDVEDIANTEYFKSIPGIGIHNSASSVFADKVARRGTGTYESLNEYLKKLDLGRVKSGFNSQTDQSKGLWENAIHKGNAFGFYNDKSGVIHGAMRQEGGQENDSNEEYRRGGQKGLKKYTSKNIQSSINDLFRRNETLFGPAGKKHYKPGLKYKSGGNWLDNLH